MMLPLPVDVGLEGFPVRRADGKTAIACLPMDPGEFRTLRFQLAVRGCAMRR